MERTGGSHYEVFLNFRGKDTRRGLVDVLRDKLKVARIRYFYDDKSLRVGDEIGEGLMRAIENSQIYIVILSRRYASSKWCLQELSFMLECRRKSKESKVILPVFYDVTVDDVKLQTEMFIADLQKHKVGAEVVEQWKNALTAVARFKALELGHTGFAVFGDLVVEEIQFRLETRRLSYHLVGMKDEVKKVKKLLDIESCDVRFLVIFGQSGTGKTTLAKLIFNQFSAHFQGSSFVADIKESSLGWTMESSPCDGYEYLENRLLQDIPGDDESGRSNERLWNKKVLIVLDDVDRKHHIEKLTSCRFGPGSRIIITAIERIGLAIRNETKDGKIPQQPKDVFFYKMEEMRHDDALQLLTRCSFGEDIVSEDHEMLARRTITSLGQRLPLTIEVVGSFLYGKGMDVWESTIKKLGGISRYAVIEKLKIIYDELDEKAKQIFLDIACFFVNMEKTYALYMWRACNVDSGVKMLTSMSLVKVVDDKFWMHEILRQLGRKIVREKSKDPGKHSRLWIHDEAWEVLLRDKDKKQVEGLRLSYDDSLRDQTLEPAKFTDLEQLRFLRLYYTSFCGDLKDVLSSLRWLSWHHCPCDLNANDISLYNLVVLELSKSSIKDGWRGWGQLQRANNLKVLDVRNCQELTRISNFSKYKNLERLVLQDCRKLTAIDDSVGEVRRLKCLTIKGCDSLTKLPEELGKLQALEEVVISKGKRLPFKLPESIGQLKSLSVLVVENVEISEFPDVGGLEKLERLSLSRCSGIEQLPDSVGNLKSLVELDISDTAISRLPRSIENLKELKVIKMERGSIQEFPGEIGKLEKLEEIHAKESKQLGGEIQGIDNLLHLRILDLSYTSLIGLPQKMSPLSLLQKLHLDGCSLLRGLTELPENLTSLHTSFQLLHEVQALMKLNNVVDLVIFDAGGDEPQQFDDVFHWIGKLPELEHLELAIPPSLVSWQDKFCASSQLKFLKLSCSEILHQNGLKLPSSLSSLSLLHFEVNISFFDNLAELTYLELGFCTILGDHGDEGTVDIRILSLVHFNAQECRFDKAKVLHPPRYLRLLHLSRCEFPGTQLELLALENLKELKISSCRGLVGVQGIDDLEQLQELVIDDCNCLKWLKGDVSRMGKLRFLQLWDCENLEHVEGRSRLKRKDTNVQINGCPQLKDESRKRKRPFSFARDEDSSC